jgi:DNA-binding transcriptional ArsR family regulator
MRRTSSNGAVSPNGASPKRAIPSGDALSPGEASRSSGVCPPDCKCVRCRYREYAALFDTLGNQNRLLIIAALQRGGPKNVSQIVEDTGLEQTSVSHSLRKLERGRFVTAQRRGKFRVYTLKASVKPIMALIGRHISEQDIRKRDIHKQDTRDQDIQEDICEGVGERGMEGR